MKQELLKDILIVFGVWFAIAYVASGFPPSFVPHVLGGVGLIWIIGVAGGTAAVLAVREWSGNKAQRKIEDAVVGSALVEATIMDGDSDRTLYHVPLPCPPTPERAGIDGHPAHKLPWWAEYARQHPAHAAVIDESYAVMQSRKDLPAGVDKHQGVTLVEHSMNVMESLLAIAPEWAFEGVKNSKGRIIAPLIDASGKPHTFDDGSPLTHPILPVAAFAHDIGKVTCLVMEGGKPTAMLAGHGEKGAALLRAMPTVAALPMEDRDSLLMAVKYYHHLSDMPLTAWLGDRTRSLTALLYVADCRSAYNKHRGRTEDDEAATLYPITEAAHTPTEAPTTDEQAVAEPTEPTPAEAPEASPAELAQAQPTATDLPPLPPLPPLPESAPAEADYAMDNGASPLDLFTDLIDSPEAVNSKAKQRRLGWKYGEWTFIQLDAIRLAAANLAADKTIMEGDASKSVFMRTLLRQLASKGWLYLGDPARNPHEAIWRVASSRSADQGADTANSYLALVIRSVATVRLAATADCPASPRITDPDSGWQQPSTPETGAKSARTAEARAEIDQLDALMNGFMPSDNSCCDVTKERSSMVARRNERPPLTAGVLVALVQEKSSAYGLSVKRKGDGPRFASFDVDALREAFAFDTDHLPDGVRYVEANQKLWVRLP